MNVHILGIPMDLGQERRGVDMGPSAIRYAGLHSQIRALDLTPVDHGNLVVPNPEEAIATAGDNRLQAVAQVCQAVFEWGRTQIVQQSDSNEVTLFLGGDHSISIGSVKAAAANSAQTGVIWIDAHADFNTPQTSPSGNIHGMPVAVLTGDGADQLVNIGRGKPLRSSEDKGRRKAMPQQDHSRRGEPLRSPQGESEPLRSSEKLPTIPANNIVQIGIRDVDLMEAERVRQSDICVYTMSEIDSRGIAEIAAETLTYLSHCDRIHVSLDLDSLDPSQAPGVGTPVKGGLSYREAHLLAEMLGDSGQIRTMDVVEVNPILDEKNVTAEVAVELIASLLGKKIL